MLIDTMTKAKRAIHDTKRYLQVMVFLLLAIAGTVVGDAIQDLVNNDGTLVPTNWQWPDPWWRILSVIGSVLITVIVFDFRSLLSKLGRNHQNQNSLSMRKWLLAVTFLGAAIGATLVGDAGAELLTSESGVDLSWTRTSAIVLIVVVGFLGLDRLLKNLMSPAVEVGQPVDPPATATALIAFMGFKQELDFDTSAVWTSLLHFADDPDGPLQDVYVLHTTITGSKRTAELLRDHIAAIELPSTTQTVQVDTSSRSVRTPGMNVTLIELDSYDNQLAVFRSLESAVSDAEKRGHKLQDIVIDATGGSGLSSSAASFFKIKYPEITLTYIPNKDGKAGTRLVQVVAQSDWFGFNR